MPELKKRYKELKLISHVLHGMATTSYRLATSF